MSRRNKLAKFAELSKMPFVFQCFSFEDALLYDSEDQPVDFKNKWAEKVFKNDHPITLELACGRGEYSLALAAMYPERNFIGIDIKGARLWRGGKNAIEQGLTNIAFVRCRIELLRKFFGSQEISEIWITFPDPFHGKESRRLTSPNFLKSYSEVLKKDALCHLKTDNRPLYEYSLESLADYKAEVIYQNDDIYSQALHLPELAFKTYYEKQHLENQLTIKYVQFKLN